MIFNLWAGHAVGRLLACTTKPGGNELLRFIATAPINNISMHQPIVCRTNKVNISANTPKLLVVSDMSADS